MKKCIIYMLMLLFVIGCKHRKPDNIDQIIGFSFQNNKGSISCSTIYPKGVEPIELFDRSRTFPEVIDNVDYMNYSGFKNDAKVFQVSWQSVANENSYKPIKVQIFSNKSFKLIFKDSNVILATVDENQTFEKPYVFESGKYDFLCYFKGKQPEAN